LDDIWNSVSQIWGLALAHFRRDTRGSNSLRKVVFPQKNCSKFAGLATSGRHNSVMIIDRLKFMAMQNDLSTGCLVSIFTIIINLKFFPWTVHCTPERYLRKFSATTIVRHCPVVCCSVCVALSHRYGSGMAYWAIYWRNVDWIGNWK